ncbi:MAG TPA: hypothetical protein VL793_09505 [Patescibacteria group bacterium]|nr:hypothetical protein [Patescibacteria group bacterium]
MNQDIFRARNPGRTPVLKNVFRKDIFERGKAAMTNEFKQEETEAQGYEAGLALRG